MLAQPNFAAFSGSVIAVVIDHNCTRLLGPLSVADAETLQGCTADDPGNWDDLALLWPRYRFEEENSEFLDGLPIREVDQDAARAAVEGADAWTVVDLVGKRLVSGGQFARLRLWGTPIQQGESPREPVILPPWWKLCEHDDRSVFEDSRVPEVVPCPDREVLWGPVMTRFFAERMVEVLRRGEPWIGCDEAGRPCGIYERTCAIHRDWLMTPREELGGRIPRDCLHIAKDWISSLADQLQFRVAEGAEPVPIPTSLSTYANAPLGRHEVVLYFDACRETLEAGWRWLIDHQQRAHDSDLPLSLASFMDEFLAQWCNRPFEGGPSPSEIIRSERRRVPLVARDEEHSGECDCPICEVLASGMFGPQFIQYDGYQLDLDDEFAFSMWATKEEWESEQADWAELRAQMEAETKSAPANGLSENAASRLSASLSSEADEFQSAWQRTLVSDKEIPGDRHGHLKLAFLVAEMGTALMDAGADRDDLDELNAAFRNYRNSAGSEEHPAAAEALKRTLELLAEKHQTLVSRSADLQSRIDERQRAS